MKITVVMGFFLPMPPAVGGATEKTWHRLALELARRGHEITVLSRRWRDWPRDETIQGVRYLRLPGFDHRRKLWQNLVLDFIWSRRVHARLPEADVVVHAVSLPVWLGSMRPRAGRVVLMPGRMPKGQYRHYRRISRVLATSTPVRASVLAENPALEPITAIYGYPITWESLARPRSGPGTPEVTIGYVGRLHPEKGIDLLVDAVIRLQADRTLPPWRLTVCGPGEVPAGGGGPGYVLQLQRKLRQSLPESQWSLRPAINHDDALADLYRSLDIFCYPSLAAGETFGVAVAEAMAAGAVPVVSELDCFLDFVRPGENGLTFDHTAHDAAGKLADALAGLIRDGGRRATLATAAQAEVRRFDYGRYVDALEKDFARLIG